MYVQKNGMGEDKLSSGSYPPYGVLKDLYAHAGTKINLNGSKDIIVGQSCFVFSATNQQLSNGKE